MPEKLICGLCAAEDRELHYHAEQTEDGTANGQPILVCAACDALGLEFHALDLAFLKMKIISLANGNPGALDALLRGVKLFGQRFIRRLEYHGLAGCEIYLEFNDVYGRDPYAFMAQLEQVERIIPLEQRQS